MFLVNSESVLLAAFVTCTLRSFIVIVLETVFFGNILKLWKHLYVTKNCLNTSYIRAFVLPKNSTGGSKKTYITR